jgi:hypothetical protein
MPRAAPVTEGRISGVKRRLGVALPPGAAPPRPHVTAPKARRLALGKLSPDVFPTYFNAAD